MDEDKKLDYSNTLLPVVITKPKREFREEKVEEFNLYIIWKSLPAFYKKPPVDKKTKQRPSSREFLEMMGVEDELSYELAELKTQKAFAERYDLDESTLVKWNSRPEITNQIQTLRNWGMTLTKNVMFAHYNKILQTADPILIMTWYKFVEGWEEKAKPVNDNLGPVVQINYSVRDPKQMQAEVVKESGALIIKQKDANT